MHLGLIISLTRQRGDFLHTNVKTLFTIRTMCAKGMAVSRAGVNGPKNKDNSDAIRFIIDG